MGLAVFEARAATVVQDLPQQTMLFVPAGVVCALPVDDDGSRAAHARPSLASGAPAARPFGILSFAWPDTPYAILLLLDTDGTSRGWYVNLQTPLARTPIGFDTVDHALDVLIALDRSSWSWKDEDELAEAVALGLFTEADAASFRYWGERAVEHLVLRLPPFDTEWADWRPDPTWSMPELPPGWDHV